MFGVLLVVFVLYGGGKDVVFAARDEQQRGAVVVGEVGSLRKAATLAVPSATPG
jgi:hypothetical protein